MSINLETIVKENIENEFNIYVYKLINVFSLEEICSHIYKSKFINIVLLEKLYNSIVNNNSINTNLVLNNLFIKVISHNIAKEIPEKDVIRIIKDIDIALFEGHSCELNYHNFKESPCIFSIYKSFNMCLYHYLNNTYISNNGYISEYFVKKYLQRNIYKIFKNNTITLSYNTHYLKKEYSDNNRYENLNSLLDSIINKNKIIKISINNSLLWDNIQKETLDISYLFLNHFREQELIIKAKSFAYWSAINKIYRWMSWCYWNPESPFRIRKLTKQYNDYKNSIVVLYN